MNVLSFLFLFCIGYYAYSSWHDEKQIVEVREKYGDDYHQHQKNAIADLILTKEVGMNGEYLNVKNNDIIPVEYDMRRCIENNCDISPVIIGSRSSVDFPDVLKRTLYYDKQKVDFTFPQGTYFEFKYRNEVIKSYYW